MFDIDRWVEIWVTITRNKTRSLLTGFGVFWGILMLVILLGSGNGFKNGVLKNVDGFSTNSAFFFSERTGEPYKGYKKGRSARAYGRYQNVFLTDEEMADLQSSFPTVWGQYIEKLSEYMASTGKRYQSHAATIRRWAGEDAKKAAPPSRNRDYSVKEDETV